MMKDSRFGYEDSINKCFGVFHWDNADSTLDVGYNAKKDTKTNHASKTLLYFVTEL